MPYATPDGIGNLRRERLRNARLYFVCDARPGGEDPEPLLRAALDGGVDVIQLREKSGDSRMIDRSSQTFRRLADTYGVPFFVNDDPEFAVHCRADGVHIGQDDMPVEEARRIVGNDVLIGLSTHSTEQIDAAKGVDHISVGPVWETPTKAGRPAVGLDLVTYAARNVTLPFFAIGGIDPDNVKEVLNAGARRICVVRAIRDAADPAGVAEDLRRSFASVGGEVAPVAEDQESVDRGRKPPRGEPDAMKAGYAKAEIKNQAVRDSLDPLEPGERPTVVTVGAIFAAVVAAIFWVSTGIAAFTGAEVNGSRPNLAQLVFTAMIMSVMFVGMWQARYWAVLGFQMLLVLLIIAAIAGLVVAGTLLQLISTLLLTVGLSILFWYMVKAMARIQMPKHPSARSNGE